MAIDYGHLGLHDAAADICRKAIGTKADYADAHCGLGTAYRSLGRDEEAVEAYRQAIRFKHDLGPAHCGLGLAFSKLGRYKGPLRHANMQ